MKYKRPESVLVVIYTRGGEVLLLERCRPPGYWQSVTGSLEWGESARAAAIREVREETGLEIRETLVDCRQQNRFPILPAWRSRYAPEIKSNLEHVFRVMLPAELLVKLDPSEHKRAIWLPAEAAQQKASSTTNQRAIEEYVVHGH